MPTSVDIFYIRQVAVGWGVEATLEPYEDFGFTYYNWVYIYEGLFSLVLVKDI